MLLIEIRRRSLSSQLELGHLKTGHLSKLFKLVGQQKFLLSALVR